MTTRGPAESAAGEDAPDLAVLVGASARGDRAAFAQLYDATAPRVYGLALRVVRNPALAEEVTQEVFLEVWRHSARYQETRGSVTGWLMMLAHRRAVDRVRATEAASRQEQTYLGRNQVVEHDSTAEAVERSLEARRVQSALQTLTDIQREALELAYFGGYTHTEVAGLLDVPLGTTKTRIRDALIRLRDSLGVTR